MLRHKILPILSLIAIAFSVTVDAQVKKGTTKKPPAKKKSTKVINRVELPLPEGASYTEGSKPGWTKYVDTKIGYTFEFPSKWQIIPFEESSEVGIWITDQPDFFGKKLPEGVYVNISAPPPSGEKVELRQMIEEQEKALKEEEKSVPKAKRQVVIKSEFFTWNGVEAHRNESRAIDIQGSLRRSLIFTLVIDGKVVGIMLTSTETKFAKYLPTFNQIADSLKLTK